MWQYNELSDERIKPATSGIGFNPRTDYFYNAKIRVKFHESCLKQEKITFDQKTVLDFDFDFQINLWLYNVARDFALENFLFGAAELIENADPYKYYYSGYGTGWMHVELFHYLMVVGLVITWWYWIQTWVHLCLLVIIRKTFWFLLNVQQMD